MLGATSSPVPTIGALPLPLNRRAHSAIALVQASVAPTRDTPRQSKSKYRTWSRSAGLSLPRPMARISRAKLSDRFCSAVISCLLQVRNPRVATQDGHVSRQGIANERRNLVADQLNGSHDVPMLHADPLKPCDEPTAARCTQQVDDLFSTLLGRTDNEAVLEQILELGLRSGIADDL